ncbi:hypothetical protein ACOMHN_060916 [Nucella lapillus]
MISGSLMARRISVLLLCGLLLLGSGSQGQLEPPPAISTNDLPSYLKLSVLRHLTTNNEDLAGLSALFDGSNAQQEPDDDNVSNSNSNNSNSNSNSNNNNGPLFVGHQSRNMDDDHQSGQCACTNSNHGGPEPDDDNMQGRNYGNSLGGNSALDLMSLLQGLTPS